MSSEDQNNISNIDSMTACQFCGKCYKGIKIHISKAHPEQYRSLLLNPTLPCSVPTSTIKSSNNQTSPLPDSCKYTKELVKWLDKFDATFDDLTFNNNYDSFVEFLSTATDLMPGPKNPAKKYIEARKNGHFKNNNRQYSDSSNPQRASKNDRLRRKAKFDYDLIQYEY